MLGFQTLKKLPKEKIIIQLIDNEAKIQLLPWLSTTYQILSFTPVFYKPMLHKKKKNPS